MKHLFKLALMVSPLLAHAAGGAYEINQDCVAAGCFPGDAPGFPVTITQSGSYVLTSDIAVTIAGAVAININAQHVDLDLNNHTIDGGGNCSGIPVTACTSGNGEFAIIAQAGGAPIGTLRIHDGTIRGFTYIAPADAAGAIVINNAGDGTVLDHLTLVENGSNTFVTQAIGLNNSGPGGVAVLRDSRVARTAGNAIQMNGQVALSAENNDISGNENSGVVGGLNGSTFVGNRFSDNGGWAINGGGGTPTFGFGGNTFSGNNGGGANAQYVNVVVRDMGGNVCIDHTPCP